MVNFRLFPLLLACSLILAARPCVAGEIDDLLAQVDEAVADESYTRAISLLEEGKRSFPGDPRLPAKAGRLYMERELYHLAIAEFLAADAMDPNDPQLRFDMATTYGYLGDNLAAVDVLEDLLSRLESGAISSRDSGLRDDVVDDLSWMYFKTYQLDLGIALLERALDERFDRNWAQTLGTLYSGKYDREKSRYWYERSIDDAMKDGDEYFASVARYNLSLLEFTFYRYDDARDEAERSIQLRNRAGGHLVVGELNFLSWNLDDAVEEYRIAESLDETPLARVDLAGFYQRIGMLDEAIRLIDDIRAEADESWMYHYGLDRVRFATDLHSILRDSFRGKAEVDSLTPKYGLISRIRSLFVRTEWRLRGMYHDRRYRALTAQVARELSQEGNELDSAWNNALANQGYRHRAVKSLEKARRLETSIMPQAEPWYLLEIGSERRDPQMIMEALERFGPGEGDPRERGLRLLSGSMGPAWPRSSRNISLDRLYRMNPGGLRPNGLSLPMEIHVAGEGGRKLERRLSRTLRRAGYTVHHRPSADPALSVLTVARDGDGDLKWFMADPQGRTRASLDTEGDISRRRTAEALGGLLALFYTTRIEGGA